MDAMTTTAPPTTEAQAIQAVIDDVAAGVTARDADRCASHFAPDARSVITTGQRSVGREAIHAAHVAGFAAATVPTNARFDIVDLTFPRPDVALATTEATAGTSGPTTVVTWLLTREDDRWLIAARQFTRVT